jgi:glycerol-3-phosphate dehydrogenase
MIARNPVRAQESRFDLIVVGGGIYGVALTLEAARSGLRPLLLERDDFGQHTSSSWLRFLHGGLRHLQRMDLVRHYESVVERRWYLSTFPDLVEPIQCVMPIYGDGLRRMSVMAGVLALNDLLSPQRNRGLRPDRLLPRGRTISRSEVRRLAPGVEPSGLQGGAVWYDAVARRPQRVLMEMLRWGAQRGATALNYVEVQDLLQNSDGVQGVQARDARTRKDLQFLAPVVVNCAGPWSGALAGRLHDRPAGLFRPSLALNVLTDRSADFDGAVAVTARRPGARTYFLLAWAGKVLAGTYHAGQGTDRPGGQETNGAGSPAPGIEEELVSSFLEELNEAAPWLELSAGNVVRSFSGQLPVRRSGTVELSGREIVHDHETHGGPRGLFSVSGVKYTAARRVAARALGRISRRGMIPRLKRDTDAAPPPLIPPEPADMARMVRESPETARAIVGTLVAEESVLQPDDLFLRRTGWGEVQPPPKALKDLVEESLSRAPKELRP